ncbi:hypothetical protein GCM10023211_09190 [Orbus sasakiae]|uniref:Uncharacterized protein n=1 Tax=Orbus sasakiae TaxID=1078475 RepID=A0ABP9N6M8_9GAMM
MLLRTWLFNALDLLKKFNPKEIVFRQKPLLRIMDKNDFLAIIKMITCRLLVQCFLQLKLAI